MQERYKLLLILLRYREMRNARSELCAHCDFTMSMSTFVGLCELQHSSANKRHSATDYGSYGISRDIRYTTRHGELS